MVPSKHPTRTPCGIVSERYGFASESKLFYFKEGCWFALKLGWIQWQLICFNPINTQGPQKQTSMWCFPELTSHYFPLIDSQKVWTVLSHAWLIFSDISFRSMIHSNPWLLNLQTSWGSLMIVVSVMCTTCIISIYPFNWSPTLVDSISWVPRAVAKGSWPEDGNL